jgi:cytoskeleton protein RodZ
MSVQAGGDTRCGIGTRLRAGREGKGLTVLQAAEKLHVDSKILESLESEDFEALGAPVYVRGHLRHYAELVGEKTDELQSLYSNSIRVMPPDLTQIPKAQLPSETRRLVVPATVVLLVFAIAGAVWWIVTLSKGQQPKPAQAASVAAPASAPPESGSAVTSPVPVPADAPTPPKGPIPVRMGRGIAPETAEDTRHATAASAGRQRAATPPDRSASGASEASSPAAKKTPPDSASDGTPPPAARASSREAQLTLRFTAESWAEVYDSKGERLFYDIGSADSVHTFKGVPPLRVVLGNAPGVAVEVNGRAADLATLTHPDGSAQFVVGRAGRVSQPSP